ncbi:MAG: hypothetical protein JST54_01625 [Deltaproteobacteria bacterium]|nr:hypothetical protein [Deltaproteobacteria bacterium]
MRRFACLLLSTTLLACTGSGGSKSSSSGSTSSNCDTETWQVLRPDGVATQVTIHGGAISQVAGTEWTMLNNAGDCSFPIPLSGQVSGTAWTFSGQAQGCGSYSAQYTGSGQGNGTFGTADSASGTLTANFDSPLGPVNDSGTWTATRISRCGAGTTSGTTGTSSGTTGGSTGSCGANNFTVTCSGGATCPAHSTCVSGGCNCADGYYSASCEGVACTGQCTAPDYWCAPRQAGVCGAANFTVACPDSAGTYYCPTHSSCGANRSCTCDSGYPAKSCGGSACNNSCSYPDWWCELPATTSSASSGSTGSTGTSGTTTSTTGTSGSTGSTGCVAPEASCGGACYDVDNDPTHCGSGCMDCASNESEVQTATCHNGVCGVGTCNAGYVDCDGQATNGCELYCGGIANAVASCYQGSCDYASCDPGYIDCDLYRGNGCEVHGTACPTPVTSGIYWGGSSTLGLAVDDTNLYWIASSGVEYLPKAGGSKVSLGVGRGQAAADGTYVYWSDIQYNGEGAGRVMADGGGELQLGAQSAGFWGTIVARNGVAYWNSDTNVYASPVDGGAISLATNSNTITAVTADDQYVYFAAGDGIWRVPAGGGTAQRFANSGSNLYVKSMAVDANLIYWSDASADKIFTFPTNINADGGRVSTLVQLTCQPSGMVLDSSQLFVACNNAVLTVDPDGGITYNADGRSSAWNVAVDATAIYWIEISGGTGAVFSVPRP